MKLSVVVEHFRFRLLSRCKKRSLSLDAFRGSHDQVRLEMAEASQRSGRFFCHRCSTEISPRLPVRTLEAPLPYFKTGNGSSAYVVHIFVSGKSM